MGNIKLLGNVGSQKGALGYSVIFACQNVATSEFFFAQVEKQFNADGTPKNPVVKDWKWKSKTWAKGGSTSGIVIDSRVNIDLFTDTKPSFVIADDVIPDAEFTNAGGNKNIENPTGNVAVLSLLGDGVSASFIDTIGFSSSNVGVTHTVGLAPATATPTGVVASINTFISENPITSFLIALLIGFLLYLAYQAYSDSEGKEKKKGKRRRS
jgi:hypothetical protein